MSEFKIHQTLPLEQKIDFIRLARTNGVGCSTFLKLLNIFDNINDAINSIGDFSIKGGSKKPLQVASKEIALKELEDCKKLNSQIICLNEQRYPQMLRQIDNPPPLITVRGNLELMHKNIVAIVGTRNSSLNGSIFAKRISYELGQNNIIIASGMARGIDANAHEGSLNSGTIGVIANGIDKIYPRENTNLYSKVIQKGLLISEQPFGSSPKSGNFPKRNRIISGLSLGVVVVEAALRSGTLITSRYALEQNREVFAVPGSPFDPRHGGANRLIKQGAKMVENSEDILNEINSIIYSRERFSTLNDSFEQEFANIKFKKPDEDIVQEARKLILEKISFEPISINLLIEELQLPVKITNIALVQLELAGRVNCQDGNVVLIFNI